MKVLATVLFFSRVLYGSTIRSLIRSVCRACFFSLDDILHESRELICYALALIPSGIVRLFRFPAGPPARMYTRTNS